MNKTETLLVIALLTVVSGTIIYKQETQIRKLTNINQTINNYLKAMVNIHTLPEDKIVDLKNAKFYLPNYPRDFIQNTILNESNFYEIDILKTISAYIPKDAVILDIGANIGNHSLYFALHNKAKKVYAFEPIKSTFDILQKNIQINHLENTIIPFNLGLSDKQANASITHYNLDNIGETSIAQTQDGDIKVDALDNLNLNEDHIDFVKIDVEAHELYVLRGAQQTLKKYKPIIFIEIVPDYLMEVDHFLQSIGYHQAKAICGHNYIYVQPTAPNGF